LFSRFQSDSHFHSLSALSLIIVSKSEPFPEIAQGQKNQVNAHQAFEVWRKLCFAPIESEDVPPFPCISMKETFVKLLSFSFLLMSMALSGCGPQSEEESTLHRLANPRVRDNFHGWAICTAEPYLNIREFPHASAAISGNVSRCRYGEEAYVDGLTWDEESQQYFAQLPGWGSGGTMGYADWRWLEIRDL
jgi:hypothetical protein